MKRYSKDPKEISTKFTSRCKTCNCILHKGEKAFYWPATRSIFCPSCGEADYRDFISSAMDEEVYHGRGNPW